LKTQQPALAFSGGFFDFILLVILVLIFQFLIYEDKDDEEDDFPFSPKNNKSRPDLAVKPGQMGDGSSPCSLSRASIWRSPFGGCWFPDAILHGKRSYRPRSRAVRHFAARGF
jgi:hypothetical protein